MPPEPEILETGRSTLNGGAGPRRLPSRLPSWFPAWLPLACALVAGLLLGAAGAFWWDARQDRDQRLRADREIDVRVALGADNGISEQNSLRVVVATDLVLLNAGPAPLVLEGFEIDGPGARLVTTTAGWRSTALPQELPPGEAVTNTIGLVSDCAVLDRPLPTITLQLRDRSGQPIRRSVWIPDLEGVWGQTLEPQACTDIVGP